MWPYYLSNNKTELKSVRNLTSSDSEIIWANANIIAPYQLTVASATTYMVIKAPAYCWSCILSDSISDNCACRSTTYCRCRSDDLLSFDRFCSYSSLSFSRFCTCWHSMTRWTKFFWKLHPRDVTVVYNMHENLNTCKHTFWKPLLNCFYLRNPNL